MWIFLCRKLSRFHSHKKAMIGAHIKKNIYKVNTNGCYHAFLSRQNMLVYPVQIREDGNRFIATFRDIPEALTGGSTVEETLNLAKDALVTVMDFYFDDKRTVPLPSNPLDQELLVSLPLSLTAKILLLNEMISQNVRPTFLAKKLGVTKQEVNRLTNLKHQTKIDTIADAMLELGKKLTLSTT